MAKKAREKTVEERIRSERTRLTRHYRKAAKPKKDLAAGLIDQAAFMRVQLEELNADLLANGWTETFTQKGMEPCQRARPQGQAYQSMNANYQKIIKELDALLPDAAASELDDGFDNFVSGRGEL